MTDMQIRLGRSLLQSLVELRQQKGDVSLEDVGDMFMQMAESFQSSSSTDRFMHQEIARLARYIVDAKKEIFAITTNNNSEPVVSDASAHLDEVIKSTEEATHTIMDSADKIQTAASGIDGAKEQQVMDACMRIYEACNFQDVTGQRIRKVIKLLENIEERVAKLNELFGNEDDLQRHQENKPVGMPVNDKDLLNGPQLKANASSQAEIDALFASLGGKA